MDQVAKELENMEKTIFSKWEDWKKTKGMQEEKLHMESGLTQLRRP